MNLTSSLRIMGYDLIESPIRNQKLGQLWLKRDFDKIQMYFDQMTYAFKSKIDLVEYTTNALNVTSFTKNEFSFNIGITVVEEVLKSIGISDLNLSKEIKSGKNIAISYDNSFTKEIEIGMLESFLSNCDFVHPNELLLKNLNKNDVIVTTGVLFAKNLIVEIETEFCITTETKLKLTEIGEGKLDFTTSSENKLKMTSETGNFYPIAVRASRLDFDHGKFKEQNLITDSRNFF